MTSIGQTSLSRVVAGADMTAHNLINGIVIPVSRQVVRARGCQYRSNSTHGAPPVLTSQQLQAATTSLDRRITNIQRDVVNLLTRACQTSDALGRKHPAFDDIGAVHLRLTIAVPTTAPIEGFVNHDVVMSATSPTGSPGGPAAAIANSERDDLSTVGTPVPSDSGETRLRRTDSFFIDGADADSDTDDAALAPAESSEVATGDTTPSGGLDLADTSPLSNLGLALLNAKQEPSEARRRFTTAEFAQWVKTGRAYGFFSWAKKRATATCGQVGRVANPTGARDLYVLDVTLPTEVFTSCTDVSCMIAGEEKSARNIHLQKAQRKLRRIVSGKVTQASYTYLETITHLVVMALFMDAGDTGKNHCQVLAYSGDQPVFRDFFADKNLEPALDELSDAKKDAGHPDEKVVWAVPAPEVKGTLNETLVLYESPALGEYELREWKPVLGAVHVGVDLFGKPAPNDHTNPLSHVSAVYRHMGDSDTIVAEGTPHEFVVHLDRSERAKMSDTHDRVWEDLISDHRADFEDLLKDPTQRFDYDFLVDGKPSSYTSESYMGWLEEQIADEKFFGSEHAMLDLLEHVPEVGTHVQQLRGTASCKKGEDSARARFVITPGVMGSEGLHQARTSPLIRALEVLHAVLYNHTTLKGLTEETKRIRFAEFLRAVPKGAIVFGTDKSKNDACFREPVWKKCVKYLAVMDQLFHNHVTTTAYVYSPDENHRREAFPNGTLDMKYWVLRMTPLIAILLSGIGPTSFFNRLESTTEKGVSVLNVYGEEAYQKWRKSCRQAEPSNHPAWDLHPAPHVSEHTEWRPLAPKMVTDTSIKVESLTDEQILTPHMGSNEGDDQSHCIVPPTSEGWEGLKVREIIMKYTAALSAGTGFIFEPAMAADDLDMVGRNSVFEMLSAWTGLPHGKADAYEVAVIVPKVLKALRKLPHCTISSKHAVTRNEHNEPVDVTQDSNYWALALTKYYTLAIVNHESLGVRGLFLAHGNYCFERLAALKGKQGAYSHATVYGDRDPERRGIEESASTTFTQCGELRDRAHDINVAVIKERVIRVCCTAWRSDLPELARLTKEEVHASLYALDSATMRLTVTESMISDPMVLWTYLSDTGCVMEALVQHATVNLYKTAAMYRSPKVLADPAGTVQLARKLAGTKPEGSASKGGGSGKAAKSGDAGPKGAGKSKDSSKAKGGKGNHSNGKGKSQGAQVGGKTAQATKGGGKGKSQPPPAAFAAPPGLSAPSPPSNVEHSPTGKSARGGKADKAKGGGKAGKGETSASAASGSSWFPKPSWGKSRSDNWWRSGCQPSGSE